jgi:hypothetical protein
VSSGEEEIPYRSKGKAKTAAPVEEDDEEGSEAAEDEYALVFILIGAPG